MTNNTNNTNQQQRDNEPNKEHSPINVEDGQSPQTKKQRPLLNNKENKKTNNNTNNIQNKSEIRFQCRSQIGNVLQKLPAKWENIEIPNQLRSENNTLTNDEAKISTYVQNMIRYKIHEAYNLLKYYVSINYELTKIVGFLISPDNLHATLMHVLLRIDLIFSQSECDE